MEVDAEQEPVQERVEFVDLLLQRPPAARDLQPLHNVLYGTDDLAASWDELLAQPDCLDRCCLTDRQRWLLVESALRLRPSRSNGELPEAACRALLESRVFDDALPGNIDQLLQVADPALVVSFLDGRQDVPESVLVSLMGHTLANADFDRPDQLPDDLMLALLKQPYTPGVMCAELRSQNYHMITKLLKYINRTLSASLNDPIKNDEVQKPSQSTLINWTYVICGAKINLVSDNCATSFQQELDACQQLCDTAKKLMVTAPRDSSAAMDAVLNVTDENYYIQNGWR